MVRRAVKRVRARPDRKKTSPRSDHPTDATLALPAASALALFAGQPTVTLEAVARALGVERETLAARYSDVGLWLAALLRAQSPNADFDSALRAVSGETADELLRDAMRRLIDTAQRHSAYFELALIEADRYQGGTLTRFAAGLLPPANAVFDRIKATGELRPLPDWMIARAIMALFIGFIASERAMPPVVQTASRLLPQRAWIDGITDILLYGLLEDEVR